MENYIDIQCPDFLDYCENIPGTTPLGVARAEYKRFCAEIDRIVNNGLFYDFVNKIPFNNELDFCIKMERTFGTTEKVSKFIYKQIKK